MSDVLKSCYNCDGCNDDCHICNGYGELFYIGGEKERFNLLADRWEVETIHHSVIQINHPCFGELDKMKSTKAIGWLLERMKKEPTHLMALLEMWVKKSDNPIPDKMYDIVKATEMWIKWGIEKKLIERNES